MNIDHKTTDHVKTDHMKPDHTMMIKIITRTPTHPAQTNNPKRYSKLFVKYITDRDDRKSVFFSNVKLITRTSRWGRCARPPQPKLITQKDN